MTKKTIEKVVSIHLPHAEAFDRIKLKNEVIDAVEGHLSKIKRGSRNLLSTKKANADKLIRGKFQMLHVHGDGEVDATKPAFWFDVEFKLQRDFLAGVDVLLAKVSFNRFVIQAM